MDPRRAGTLRRSLWKIVVALALALYAFSMAGRAARAVDLNLSTGLGQLVMTYAPSASVRGIAELSSVPTSAQVSALNALGLAVQPMRHVPLALVYTEALKKGVGV